MPAPPKRCVLVKRTLLFGTLLALLSLAAGCGTTITFGHRGSTTSTAANVPSASIIASCQADAKAVETALEAYKAQIGTYPLADDWGALTTSRRGPGGIVGPWVKAAPSMTHYVINFDGNGDVSADKVGVTTYQGADNIDNRPDVCTANAS